MVGNIAVISGGVPEGDSERDIVTGHESKKFKLRIEEEGEQLLPGLPNDLTFHQVAPKLPWTAFRTLLSVSRGWQQAIQSRRVYDARVCTKSTQKLVAMFTDNFEKFHLYSVGDGCCYHLPPIPGLQRLPDNCECISLDGKLYVLGGYQDSTYDSASGSVYMLDLAGQGHWKQCASMALPRVRFGCGVFGGKIYVFGGWAKPSREWIGPGCEHVTCIPVRVSEVYDPMEDSWSPITSMTFANARISQRVTTVGEELFVYEGEGPIPEFILWAQNQVIDPDDDSLYYRTNGDYLADVYHPVKDEWRTVEHYVRNPWENFVPLMVEGQPHMVNSVGLHVYDRHANSWTLTKSFSFDAIGPRDTYRVAPSAAVAVGDVLLVDVISRCWPREGNGRIEYFCMISQGLSGENKVMVFRKVECPSTRFMCLIEL